MAQFEIIDDFTFEVCLLPREKALAFCDYLNSKGTKAKVKECYSGHFGVYVTNSFDLTRAKQELLSYAQSPYSRAFTEASWAKGRTVKSEKYLRQGLIPFAFSLSSLTTIIELICVLVYLLSFGFKDYIYAYLALSRLDTFSVSQPLNYIKLITPVFVHFTILHIAFNLVMFEALARPIERELGRVKLFSLCLGIAVVSNILQYVFMTGYGVFGGLSGVVYGLIGYMGILSRRENLPKGLFIPKGLLAVSIVFIAFGFFMSGIANLCHLGGVLVGIILGYIDLKKKKFP
ncbi:MAG: rhomboid family intramembrane serine protease [Succinivibrio sp.]